MSLLERLKWWVAPKEMEELHRWRSQWEEHRRWLAEFEHTSATLDHMRSWVDGTPLIEMKSISRFREELRSKMNAQIDFLKRCKELGLQGGKLSNWLDEIESLRAENSALKQQVGQEKRDAEQWRAYQKRKQDLLDRGFLRSPLREEAELNPAMAQGEK